MQEETTLSKNDRKQIKSYDYTDKYEQHIKPIINELRKKCVVNGIPMFVSVAVKNSEKGTVYKNDTVSPDIVEQELKYDMFPKMYGVAAGMDIVPPATEFSDDIVEDDSKRVFFFTKEDFD